MRLLRKPPSDPTDIGQIKQFAQSNRIILELSKHYGAEELLEIAKHRDFFGDMERAARSVSNGVEVADGYLQELKAKLSTMIGEAERKRDRTGNEDMRCLHEYFINHYDCLTKMVLAIVSEHQKQHNAVKETNRIQTVDQNISSRGDRQLRTLEDYLIAVGAFPLLLQLDESLKQVRRGNKSLAEHEASFKLYDEELLRLSREHHPDSVARRGGPEEEVKQAKNLQTALHVAHVGLSILHKMFLRDIDIYYKYKSLAKLDIRTLGDEDEVEIRVYGALYTIALVAQTHIDGEVKKFLEAAQLCVDSYLTSEFVDFRKHRDSAFSYLETLVVQYEQLHMDLQDNEADLEKQNVHSCSIALISVLQDDCWKQLKHLEGLFELTKDLFGDHVEVYRTRDRLDDHFLLPLDCYVKVIMACSLMVNKMEDKGALKTIFTRVEQGHSQNPPPTYGSNETLNPQVSGESDDPIFLLYKLASYYVGDKGYETFVKNLLCKESIAERDVKGQFHVRLIEVRDDLKNKFEISDYRKVRHCWVNTLELCVEFLKEHLLKEPAKADTAETLPTEVVTEAKREEVLQSSPKGTSNVNPAGLSKSSTSASASNCTTARRSDAQGKRGANSTAACSKPNLKTLGDCLSYFGLDRRWQELVKFQEEVKRGTRTAEDYEAEWKRFDKQLQRLLHTHHPDFVTRRGGSEDELAHARELQAALNQTRTVLNAVNKTILEGFDFRKKKVSVYFTEVEEVKRALEFAHLRMMDMETHLEGVASGEERKATEAYRDFYSRMKRVMGAVLVGEQGAERQVAELYDLFHQLLAQSHFSKAVHVSFYTHVRLHPHKQFQEEQDELARMLMLAHYMALKQEYARLKKDLEDKPATVDTVEECAETAPEVEATEPKRGEEVPQPSPEDTSDGNPEGRSTSSVSVDFPKLIEDVKRAREFADLRMMEMERHLCAKGNFLRNMSFEEREETEVCRDFYSRMKRVMNAVLDEEDDAEEQIEELYLRLHELLCQSQQVGPKEFPFYYRQYYYFISQSPYEQLQKEWKKLEHMLRLAEGLFIKRDLARFNEAFENARKTLEGGGPQIKK